MHKSPHVSPSRDAFFWLRLLLVACPLASCQVTTITVFLRGNVTSFTFRAANNPTLAANATGRITGGEIAVTVPFGTDVTALTPTIVLTGARISPASGMPRDFTSPVIYTLTTAEGTTETYNVVVSKGLGTAKEIVRFSLAGSDASISSHAITLTVPYGTDLTALAPSITYTGVSVSPNSGVVHDFTNPTLYTVTAADGTSQSYTVTVTLTPSGAKEIMRFTLIGHDGVVAGHAVAVTVPYGTDLSALAPTVIYSGTSVSPASGAAQNFTDPVIYTVTAADGTTQDYTITVTVTPNSAKDITQFNILGNNGVIIGNAIAVAVPYGTQVAALTPMVIHTGANLSPASSTPQNFTNPVIYTVIAADGTTQAYTVTVTVVSSSAKDISDFVVLGNNAVITGNTIAVTVPYGTDITFLTPTVVHTGPIIVPTAGVPQNFTNPVVYTVTAEDGSTKAYTVTVTVAANGAKDITRFSILGNFGVITGNSISVAVPYGTDVTLLTPTIVHSGASISPASGTAHDFIHAVIYTVTAANTTTQAYTVTVTATANNAKGITQFTILGNPGVITSNTIAVTVPYGTNVTALTPTIVHTGASITPASSVAHNFTSPVIYTVTAANASTQAYTVTVSVARSGAKDISQFSILGHHGTIAPGVIALTVPYGTDTNNLTPTIVHTGASMDPASGVAQNFNSPVTYTVTAADATTQSYTVTVTVAPSGTKDITQFSILGVQGVVTSGAVAVTVPYGTDTNSLTPTIVHTGATVAPASCETQNFNSPVTYTVTAADATTQNYIITVTVALSSAKDITRFTILGVSGNVTPGLITLTVPHGTDVTALTPSITHTGDSINPDAAVPQDFTNSVIYTVTAADTSKQDYTVMVTVALSSTKDITQFTLLSRDGYITADTIAIMVPYGSNISALTPTISHTGMNISPPNGMAQDFTCPVVYTVTAASATIQNYTVTVTVADADTKSMMEFSILGYAGDILDTSATSGTIDVPVPHDTDVSALMPLLFYSGSSINFASGQSMNFTSPVVYTVTAADTSTRDYTVTAHPVMEPSGYITAPRLLILDPLESRALNANVYTWADIPLGAQSLTYNAADTNTVTVDTGGQVTAEATPGATTIALSSGILQGSVNVGVCQTTVVNSGDSLAASISESDCHSVAHPLENDLPSSEYYGDLYRITLTAQQEIVITMDTDNMLDSILVLLDASGQVVADNDDDPQTTLGVGSRIDFSGIAASGVYFIQATTFSPGSTGSYTLGVTVNSPPPVTLLTKTAR